MHIGVLAKRADCRVETIRYYEKAGLLYVGNSLELLAVRLKMHVWRSANGPAPSTPALELHTI